MENVEQNVYEILQKLNVDYIKYEHEPFIYY